MEGNKNNLLKGFILASAGIIFAVLLGVFVIKTEIAFSAFNPQINYQGKLTDHSNNPVDNGDYVMEFKFYSSSTGGTLLWTETRNGGDKVSINNGLFSVMLGEVAPLPSTQDFFNQELYLEVSVGTSSLKILTPRKKLGAVPSALFAGNTDRFGGLSTSSFLRSDQANPIATINSLTSTNIFSQKASVGDATSTNFFASVFGALTAVIDGLTATIASITNLTATNVTSTNATTTNLRVVDGLSVGGNSAFATSSLAYDSWIGSALGVNSLQIKDYVGGNGSIFDGKNINFLEGLGDVPGVAVNENFGIMASGENNPTIFLSGEGSPNIAISTYSTTSNSLIFSVLDESATPLPYADVTFGSDVLIISSNNNPVLRFTGGGPEAEIAYNTSTDILSFDGANGYVFSNDILPSANLSFNLGSSSYRWDNLWAKALNIGTSTWSIGSTNDGSLALYDDASQAGNIRFYVATSTGNIGIGTSTPAEKLVVASGSINAFNSFDYAYYDEDEDATTTYNYFNTFKSNVLIPNSIFGAGVNAGVYGYATSTDIGMDSVISSGLLGEGQVGVTGFGSFSGGIFVGETLGVQGFADSEGGYGGYFSGYNGLIANGSGHYGAIVRAENQALKVDGEYANSDGIMISMSSNIANSFCSSYYYDNQEDCENAGYIWRTAGSVPYSIYSNQGLNYFGGKVGIGTSTPQTALQVVGASTFQGDISVSGGLLDSSGNYGTNGQVLLSTGTSTLWVSTSTLGLGGSASSQWLNSGSDIYFSTGNVGIGTTTPAEKLVVASGSINAFNSFDYDYFNGDSTTTFNYSNIFKSNALILSEDYGNANVGVYGYATSTDTKGDFTNSYGVLGEGFVGVGGRGDIGGMFFGTGEDGGIGVYGIGSIVGGLFMGDTFGLVAEGDLGAQIAGSYQGLRVRGDNGDGLVIDVSDTTANGFCMGSELEPNYDYDNQVDCEGNGYIWRESGSPAYSIYSQDGINYFGGNVGIGTTSPQYNLSIGSSTNWLSMRNGSYGFDFYMGSGIIDIPVIAGHVSSSELLGDDIDLVGIKDQAVIIGFDRDPQLALASPDLSEKLLLHFVTSSVLAEWSGAKMHQWLDYANDEPFAIFDAENRQIMIGTTSAYSVTTTLTVAGAIYADHIYTSGDSFYMNGQKVLGSNETELSFHADSGQNLKLSSYNGSLQLLNNGSGGININSSSSLSVVGSAVNVLGHNSLTLETDGNSHGLTLQTNGNASNIGINANGSNSSVNLFAQHDISLTAADNIIIYGNTSIKNNLSATGTLSITGSGTSTFAGGINISSGCFAVGGVCVGGSGTTNNYYTTSTDTNWLFEQNQGDSMLTTSTTVPVWIKSGLYASSILRVDGTSSLANLNVNGQLRTISSQYPPIDSIRSISINSGKYAGLRVMASSSADAIDGLGIHVDFAMQDDSGSANVLGNVGAVRSGADNTGDLYLQTALSGTILERMRITSAGFVGIGTSTPQSALHVWSNSETPLAQIISNVNAAATAYSEISIRNEENSAGAIRILAMGTGWTSNGAFLQDSGVVDADSNLSGGLSIVARAANSNIRFYAGGSADAQKRMEIKSDGSITMSTTTGNLFEAKFLNTPFGMSVESGAFVSLNSYFGEEFMRERTSLTADTVGVTNTGWGDSFNLSVDEQTACTWNIVDDRVNGIAEQAGTGTSTCITTIQSAAGNAHLVFDADNKPIFVSKLYSSTSTGNAGFVAGFGDDANAMAQDHPANGIYFTISTSTGLWTGVTRKSSNSTLVACTGETASTTAFSVVKFEVIDVQSNGSGKVNFYVDNDLSDGVQWSFCGTSDSNIPNSGLTLEFKQWPVISAAISTFIDYYRVWQDDSNNDSPLLSLDEIQAETSTESISSSTIPVMLDVFASTTEGLRQALEANGLLLDQSIASSTRRLDGLELSLAGLRGLHDNLLQAVAMLNASSEETANMLKEQSVRIAGLESEMSSSSLSIASLRENYSEAMLMLDSLRYPDGAPTSTEDEANALSGGLALNALDLIKLDELGMISIETDVKVLGKMIFGEDNVGQAVVIAGNTSTTVSFAKPYPDKYPPVVTVSPFDFINGPYRVTRVSSSSFDIELQYVQSTDIMFSWHSFGAGYGIFGKNPINSSTPATETIIDDIGADVGTDEKTPATGEEISSPDPEAESVVGDNPIAVPEDSDPVTVPAGGLGGEAEVVGDKPEEATPDSVVIPSSGQESAEMTEVPI